MSESIHFRPINLIFTLWIPAAIVWGILTILGRGYRLFDTVMFLWTLLSIPLAFFVGSYQWGVDTTLLLLVCIGLHPDTLDRFRMRR